MSDDDRDIDVESDEGDDSDSRQPTPSRQSAGGQYYSQAEKRAHHNALERKRRDHIKDSFSSLRESVPCLNTEKVAEKRAHHNKLERKRRDHIKDSFSSLRESVPCLNTEKVASRAQILKKAAEYIVHIRKRNQAHQQGIENLKRQNTLLEAQIRTLEKAKTTGSFGVVAQDGSGSEPSYDETTEEISSVDEPESDTSDLEESVQPRRPKKQKVGHNA